MQFLSMLLALTSAVAASPIPDAEAPEVMQLEKRIGNYVQNYNGGVANFQYNQNAGTFSVGWNGNTDFVVGLGWSTGTGRTITYSGQYNPGSSGSYLTVYGWLNNPLTEYYVVESYGGYNPCAGSGVTQLGSLTSDGSSYQVCTHTQNNQPSIAGTATFPQYFSVRQNKRSSGSINMQTHFSYWASKGFGNRNFAYQVLAIEAFSGSGSGSMTLKSG